MAVAGTVAAAEVTQKGAGFPAVSRTALALGLDRLCAVPSCELLTPAWEHGSVVILGFATALGGAARLLLVILIVALVSRLRMWLTSPAGSVTVGASGVVFGYATYLVSRGLFNGRVVELILGVIVLLLFGAVLISDLIPHTGVSWEAHLLGGIGGVLAGAALARPARDGRRAPDATNTPLLAPALAPRPRA